MRTLLQVIPILLACSLNVSCKQPEIKVDADVVKDTVVGTGETAGLGMSVGIIYTAKTQDGGLIDSNDNPSAWPLELKLGEAKVMKGLDQGIVGMKVGGQRDIEIPASLAYGATGKAGVVAPNTDLNYHVKLIYAR